MNFGHAPACGPDRVAEWESSDGWECEKDVKPRNGRDDEDDAKLGVGAATKKATSTKSPAPRSTRRPDRVSTRL